MMRALGRHLRGAGNLVLFATGIRDYHWNSAPEGHTNAGSGLFLTASDLARFTWLFAQNGIQTAKNGIKTTKNGIKSF